MLLMIAYDVNPSDSLLRLLNFRLQSMPKTRTRSQYKILKSFKASDRD